MTYRCARCEKNVMPFPSGNCPFCGDFVSDKVEDAERMDELRLRALEDGAEREKRISRLIGRAQIRINGPRAEVKPMTTVPVKYDYHVKPLPEQCPHSVVLEKRVYFTDEERESALQRGLSLPNAASLDFCVECWTLNPKVGV
jgi:hypothetical protein